jgi:hypothetical protein
MENKEPSGDGAAKQEASNEKYEQEAEQILKLHRENKVFAPSAFRGALNAYLLFVAAVTGVGMLASYSHHETTANVFLVVSIPLLLIAPIGVFLYSLVTFRMNPRDKSDRKQTLLGRISQTSIGAFLLRTGNRRFVRLLQFVIPVLMVVDATIKFPQHPRLSLVVMVVYLIMISVLLAFEIARSLEKALLKDINVLFKNDRIFQETFIEILGYIRAISKESAYTKSIAENNSKYLADIAPLEKEVYERIITAIEKTDESVQELDSRTALLAAKLNATAKPKQLDATPAEDEESS